MRILGQVIEIYPSHVVISLPNQMLGHIPLPQVTAQLTERIEKLPEEGDSEDSEDESEDQAESPEAAAKRIPELQDIFRVGQYVRTIVCAVHAAGTTASNTNLVKPKNETDRGSRRIVLSTVPKEMNGGLSEKDLVAGYVSAAISRLSKALNVSTDDRGSGEERGGPWLRFGPWNQWCFRLLVLQGRKEGPVGQEETVNRLSCPVLRPEHVAQRQSLYGHCRRNHYFCCQGLLISTPPSLVIESPF